MPNKSEGKLIKVQNNLKAKKFTHFFKPLVSAVKNDNFCKKNHPVLNFRNKYRYCKNKYRRKYICHLVQVRTSMAAKFHKYIIQYNVLRKYFWVPYQTKYLLY